MQSPAKQPRYTPGAKAKRKTKTPAMDAPTTPASAEGPPSSPPPQGAGSGGDPPPGLRSLHGHSPQPPLAVGMTEAARILGIGKRKLWELTNRGEIPHIRISRRVLYSIADLQAWLTEQSRKSARSKHSR